MTNARKKVISTGDRYVPGDLYQPDREYLDVVIPMLPADWVVRPDYFWTYVFAPNARKVSQGWKVHVSATPESAVRILGKVIPVLVELNVEFKFVSDQIVLISMLSKRYYRGGSGKFMAIYPDGLDQSRRVLEALHTLLLDEKGPYVLSDRQYKDAKVLFYRYGGYWALHDRQPDGSLMHCILDNNYRHIEDVRSAAFVLPDFVTEDPFLTPELHQADTSKAAAESKTNLLNGKYKITGFFQQSNAGGVYRGIEVETGRAVVIKEARPFIDINEAGRDSTDKLRREYEILCKIADLKIAPEPLEFFRVWEHYFLVEEEIQGISLQNFVAREQALLVSINDVARLRQWTQIVVGIMLELLEKIGKMHACDVIFSDISTHNVFIDPVSHSIRFIDFEGAFEDGVDQDGLVHTHGFSPLDRKTRTVPTRKDDWFGVAALSLALLSPIFTVVSVQENVAASIIAELERDFGLPDAIGLTILELMGAMEPDIAACKDRLLACSFEQIRDRRTDPGLVAELTDECEDDVQRIFDYIRAMMDFKERGRLFPLDEKFEHPLSFDCGVAGVAWAWKKVQGEIPAELSRWLLDRYDNYPSTPGLHKGQAGWAWVLADLGFDAEAKRTLRSAGSHALLFRSLNFAFGATGWGMTNLHFYKRYGDESYLATAERVAQVLCSRAIETEKGVYWKEGGNDGSEELGLFYGNAGYALFLLYLYCQTRQERYLLCGEAALDWIFHHAVGVGENMRFPRTADHRSGILSPYMEGGFAGIASVILRYAVVTGKSRYIDFVRTSKMAVACKYTFAPGYANGLVGLGHYLLDVYQFMQDEESLNLAYCVARSVRLFKVTRSEGIGFPMAFKAHLNCDYHSGSAGIGLFLHRLVRNTPNEHFFIDRLIYDFIVNPQIESLVDVVANE